MSHGPPTHWSSLQRALRFVDQCLSDNINRFDTHFDDNAPPVDENHVKETEQFLSRFNDSIVLNNVPRNEVEGLRAATVQCFQDQVNQTLRQFLAPANTANGAADTGGDTGPPNRANPRTMRRVTNQAIENLRRRLWNCVCRDIDDPSAPWSRENFTDELIVEVVSNATEQILSMRTESSAVDTDAWRQELSPIVDEVLEQWKVCRSRHEAEKQKTSERARSNHQASDDKRFIKELVNECGEWTHKLQKEAFERLMRETLRFQRLFSPRPNKRKTSPSSRTTARGTPRIGVTTPSPRKSPFKPRSNIFGGLSPGRNRNPSDSSSVESCVSWKMCEDKQRENREKNTQHVSPQPIKDGGDLWKPHVKRALNPARNSQMLRSTEECVNKLKSSGSTNAFLPERFDNGGLVNFPSPEIRTNADAIETAAAMLGEDVHRDVPDSARNENPDPDQLVEQVNAVPGFSVSVTDISLDQLLSDFVPPDVSNHGPSECVAIIFIFCPTANRWVPHVHHPPSGVMASNRNGMAIWTGTATREKAKEANEKDREKAFLNTVQLSIKAVNDPRVTTSPCKIFFMRKEGKKQGKRKSNGNGKKPSK